MSIINLSDDSNLHTECLKFGLHHSYVNKHKSVRKNLALELEASIEKKYVLVPNGQKMNLKIFT